MSPPKNRRPPFYVKIPIQRIFVMQFKKQRGYLAFPSSHYSSTQQESWKRDNYLNKQTIFIKGAFSSNNGVAISLASVSHPLNFKCPFDVVYHSRLKRVPLDLSYPKQNTTRPVQKPVMSMHLWQCWIDY